MTDESGAIELKPCPFCGTEPKGIMAMGHIQTEAGYQMRCECCGAAGPDINYVHGHAGGHDSVAEARVGWNRREGP